MLNHYSTTSRRYNPINAYLTIQLCQMVYPGHFVASQAMLENTAQRRRNKERAYERAARGAFGRIDGDQIAFGSDARTGANWAVVATRSVAFVVFRGTEMANLTDLIFKGDMVHNVLAGQVPGGTRYGGSGSLVHSGLARSARAAAPRIINTLNNFGFGPASNRPVVVTGHSLGGAMATITGFDLNRLGHRVVAVYSHAGYMPGDARFAEAYARAGITHCRTVNEDDPVPWIPQLFVDFAKMVETMAEEVRGSRSPVQLALDTLDTMFTMPPRLRNAYCHVAGGVAYLTPRGAPLINPSTDEMMRRRRPGLNVADHATARYGGKLWRALSANQRRGLSGFRVIF